MPKKLDRCVRKVKKKVGSESKAWAICKARKKKKRKKK